MTTYIGIKKIEAEPQTRVGTPGYRVRYEDGYESWSPKEAFEKAYIPVSGEKPDDTDANVLWDFLQQRLREWGWEPFNIKEYVCEPGDTVG